ncbi:MAG: ABC transporter permease [Chloroflexota bacterium]
MAQLTKVGTTPLQKNNPLATLGWNFSDTLVVMRRNLTYIVRQPELLVFSTIQPVMFLLLFTFVFGGAITGSTGEGSYINYLLPGVLTQSIVFAATQTTVGLANDLSKGMIDRFRSLPMARGAVLGGRTLSDALRGLITISIMVVFGLLVGFRFQNGIIAGIGGMLLAVAFGYAFTWIAALIAMFVRDPETAQVAGFIWVFPLVFASSIFVPTETMPTWLRLFAENQPISVIANAVRGLMAGEIVALDLFTASAWIIGIIAVFMPLAIWQYGQRTAG